MDAQIITTVSGLTTLVLTYGLREWSNSKARKIKEAEQATTLKIKEAEQKKELTARDKLIFNRLDGLESTMYDVKTMLKDMQGDTDFRNVLRNAIRMSSDTFINVNRTLDDTFKNVLQDYAKITENISLRWYNSEYRGIGNRDKMGKYLRNYLKASLKNTDNLIDSSIDILKRISNQDTKGCLFSYFIKKNGLYNEFELLIMALCQNGFDNEKEVVEVFTDFVDKLFTKFADLITIWNTLDKKEH